MQREYLHWNSSRLRRNMELLWFGHAGLPLLMFPTSLGRFYQYEDQGLIAAILPAIEAGRVQAVCVDTVDGESWYNNHATPRDRVARHDDYDGYLRDEVLPVIHSRTGQAPALFGASFGAYHAANLAARYPEQFSRAILFSGVFDTRRFLEGYWDELCYFHCPASFIPNMDAGWCRRLATIGWVIATGEQDHLVEENRRFGEILSRQHIPNVTEIWPGVFGHDWPFWKENLPRFLP